MSTLRIGRNVEMRGGLTVRVGARSCSACADDDAHRPDCRACGASGLHDLEDARPDYDELLEAIDARDEALATIRAQLAAAEQQAAAALRERDAMRAERDAACRERAGLLAQIEALEAREAVDPLRPTPEEVARAKASARNH